MGELGFDAGGVAKLRGDLFDYSVEITRAFTSARTADGGSLGSSKLADSMHGFHEEWTDGRNRLSDSFEAVIKMLDFAIDAVDDTDKAVSQRFRR